MKKEFKTILGDREWTIRLSSMKDKGSCGEKPDLIKLRRTLQDRELVETLVHECLHALDWSKDEEWVDQAASQITDALYKLDEIHPCL